MRILFLIARQCNMLLQVKELKSKGYDNRTIASKMGTAPFIVNKCLGQAAKFKTSTPAGRRGKMRRSRGSCKDGPHERRDERGDSDAVSLVENKQLKKAIGDAFRRIIFGRHPL